ncbi:MAG: hypothetical protein MZV70_36205 [Desulfobacterales bacterium]|nr:hypothetical protein [Desulfobacterales bacterium]
MLPRIPLAGDMLFAAPTVNFPGPIRPANSSQASRHPGPSGQGLGRPSPNTALLTMAGTLQRRHVHGAGQRLGKEVEELLHLRRLELRRVTLKFTTAPCSPSSAAEIRESRVPVAGGCWRGRWSLLLVSDFGPVNGMTFSLLVPSQLPLVSVWLDCPGRVCGFSLSRDEVVSSASNLSKNTSRRFLRACASWK